MCLFYLEKPGEIRQKVANPVLETTLPAREEDRNGEGKGGGL